MDEGALEDCLVRLAMQHEWKFILDALELSGLEEISPNLAYQIQDFMIQEAGIEEEGETREEGSEGDLKR